MCEWVESRINCCQKKFSIFFLEQFPQKDSAKISAKVVSMEATFAENTTQKDDEISANYFVLKRTLKVPFHLK